MASPRAHSVVMQHHVVPSLLLGLACVALGGCQTPDPPAVPAAANAITGPAVAPSVLQQASDGRLLFPAKGGGGGHHHHGAKATSAAEAVDAGVDVDADDTDADAGVANPHAGHGAP